VREFIFSQGRQDSLLERFVFLSVDILPALTQWVLRQYFFGGHFPFFFLDTPVRTDIRAGESHKHAFGPVLVN
jgi:hypothetical protein